MMIKRQLNEDFSAECTERGEAIVCTLNNEELDAFTELFDRNAAPLVRGKYTAPLATGSFKNIFHDLSTYLGWAAVSMDPVKPSAYCMLVLTHCIILMLDQKGDYKFKGSLYNWSFNAAGDKYKKVELHSTSDGDYISFILWDDAKKFDYIKIICYFPKNFKSDNYLEDVLTKATFKVKVQRYGANAKQKTFLTTLSKFWSNLKEEMLVITEKTAI